MKLIQIKKVKKGKCSDCHKKATKEIEGDLYCAGCGDAVLLMNAKLCINSVEQATVKLSVMPKSKIIEREKHGK